MDDKEFYLDAIRDVVPEHKEEQIQDVFYSFLELEHLYDSAIELVKAQLNIFDNEFSMRFQRNPIHNIESRIKTPQSIVGKLQRKEMPVTPESARNNLTDIAGVRVICCYIDDIYAIADLLTDHSAPENQGLYQASKAKRIPEFSHDFGCSGVYVKRKRNCTG
jgi:putative GTP pyrophosphokinase